MNYFKQIFYEMKHQRMMTWVSVSGTAFAIFLVMAFIMADGIGSIEMSPESNRQRILYGKGIHVESGSNNNGSTMGLTHELAKRIYENLDGVETISYVSYFNPNSFVSVKGKEGRSVEQRGVDANFWNIYDFRFIDGHPFDQTAADDGVKEIVITESLARKLFGEEKVSGREVEVNMRPYMIVGVVEDVSVLLPATYAQLYWPWRPKESDRGAFGDTNVILLMKEGIASGHIKQQVETRYAQLNSEYEKDGSKFIYHSQPYTSEEENLSFGSNNGPDIDQHHRLQWILYAVLLILPAINLSSMTRGRLRHRVAEIGVRRAFGAKRISIVKQLFGENLIITMLGGMIGLVLSLLFLLLVSQFFFQFSSAALDATPTFEMLFSWKSFVIALGLCLVLNILSATVPAWKASRIEPAEALSASR